MVTRSSVPTNIQDQAMNHTKNIDEEAHYDDQQKQVNAGAVFVLKSKGSWLHRAYHLTTAIVGPDLLSLPYSLAFLGWTAGIFYLVIGASVTFYSYNLISLVLEHNAQFGNRYFRFRDLAHDVLGPRWCRYFVGPLQFLVCYGAVVGATLLGGQCMKAVYLLSNPNGSMKLYEFVIINDHNTATLSSFPIFEFRSAPIFVVLELLL